MRIAITGGIGSGKSFVCRLLQQHYGIEVFNCDIVAKHIIATHPDVRQALADLIAEEAAANQTGTAPEAPSSESVATPPLTKEALGAYIRSSSEHADRVNAIVHPRVAEAFELYCKQSAAAPGPNVGSEDRAAQSASPSTAERSKAHHWMECAILFESGFDRLVDHVVVVTCPTEERIRRIMARDHCSAETARRWLALQLSDEERLTQAAQHRSRQAASPSRSQSESISAPFRIINDGVAPLAPQLEALIEALS